MSTEPDGEPSPPRPRRAPPARPASGGVIPDRSADDSDDGWGERDRDSRDEEILRDRPPHW